MHCSGLAIANRGPSRTTARRSPTIVADRPGLAACGTELTERAGMDRLLTSTQEMTAVQALAFVVEQSCVFLARGRPGAVTAIRPRRHRPGYR